MPYAFGASIYVVQIAPNFCRLDTLLIEVTCVWCPRYLYYTDWGKSASIVKTGLDGSSPTVIKTGQGLNNPNGIAVTSSKIYVTDSHYKTRVPANTGHTTSKDGSLYSMDHDGTGWTDVLSSASANMKLKVIE